MVLHTRTCRRSLLLAASTLSASLSLTVGAIADSDWILQAPDPFPAKTLPEIGFFDDQRGFIVGLPTPLYFPGDRTLGTTDGGQTWQEVALPGLRYRRLCILDDLHGWAFGSDGGARTTDGGASWQSLGFVNNANQVVFRSPTFGWISDNWAVSVTHDGGFTWNHAIIGSDRVVYPDFADENLGVGIEDDGTALWRTTDGGGTWIQVFEQPYGGYNGFHTVRFLDEQTVIVAGYSKVFRSTDAGQTWSVVLDDPGLGSRITRFDEQAVLVDNVNVGYFSSDAGASWTEFHYSHSVERLEHRGGGELFGGNIYGQILHSTDFGQTWSLLYDGPDFPITSFAFPTDDHIIAAGTNMLIESFNSGTTWALTSSGSREHVNDIQVTESGIGLAAGDSSVICRTTDAGSSWGLHRDLQFVHAWTVELVTDQLAFVGGQQGWPLRSMDGGATWEEIGAGITGLAAITDFSFVNEQLGWASSGYSGTGYILHTADGGDSWVVQEGPAPGGFRAIHFFDEGTGLALHSEDLVVRTTDGGQTWSHHFLPNFAGVDMSFGSDSVGWCAGDAGDIAKTTDGGMTWFAQDSGTTENLFVVHAVSETEAWAGGAWGTLIHTTDGGQTWQNVTIDALAPLDAHFAVLAIDTNSNGSVWVAGSSGFIFHRPGETGELPGDLDGDGSVGFNDLVILLAAWGPCPPPPAECIADIDGDGAAGFSDLLYLLSVWGTS